MLIKRMLTGTFQDEADSMLLKVSSKGVDDDQLDKVAADSLLDQLDIQPKKGHSYIHLVTLGAGEWYGANANTDYFNESSRMETFPDVNGKEASEKLQDGLLKCHDSYMEYGAAYHNHLNSKKGHKPRGQIKYASYNKDMHRGQVVIEVEDDLKDDNGNYIWHDTIEKLANDQLVPFSQGCSVKWDICSICMNKAATASEHCDHIKNHGLEFHKSGKQVYMINDYPYFHDISKVNRPADRIALSLEKVASRTEGFELDNDLYVPIELVNKLGTQEQQDRFKLLHKLAGLEKKIPAMADDVVSAGRSAMCHSDDEEQEIVDTLKGVPEEFILDSMNSRNMLLTPKTFTIIVLKQNPEDIPGFSGIHSSLNNVFSKLLDCGDPNEVLSDGSYKPISVLRAPYAEDKIKKLTGLLSLDDEPVQNRVIKVSLKGGPEKLDKDAAEVTPEVEKIAEEYVKYQLSFLASGKQDTAREFLVVAGNSI